MAFCRLMNLRYALAGTRVWERCNARESLPCYMSAKCHGQTIDAQPSFLGRCCCSTDESACLHLPFKPCLESNSSPKTCLSARISTSIPACVQWSDRGGGKQLHAPLSIRRMQDMLYDSIDAALQLVVTSAEKHAATAGRSCTPLGSHIKLQYFCQRRKWPLPSLHL